MTRGDDKPFGVMIILFGGDSIKFFQLLLRDLKELNFSLEVIVMVYIY
jgi:hypothetical protein